MKEWYFVIDVEKCEDCKNCFLSCKDEFVGNDWPGYSAPMPEHGQSWIKTKGKERGEYPFIDVAYLTVPCMHCDDAPCISASGDRTCYKRPDGIVIIDPVRARGRKDLTEVCPYGAIRWNEALGVPQKCTLCAHLLDSGWQQPRCVQACPTGALRALQSEPEEIKQRIKTEGLEVYLPELGTCPRVLYKNLYRFTRCFIGGNVATRVDNREECVAGARVLLFDSSGSLVAELFTDNYGEFKFDNLCEGSGRYTVEITRPPDRTKVLAVDLAKSLSIGVIYLDSQASLTDGPQEENG